jgi:hypothetical protein
LGKSDKKKTEDVFPNPDEPEPKSWTFKKSSFQRCLTTVFLIEKKYFDRIGDNFTT